MNKSSIKRNLKTLALYFYAQIKHIQPSISKKQAVLIPFFGRLGDMIMFLDAFQEWKRLLIKEQGKEVVFACRAEVWKLLEAIGYTEDIDFMELNSSRIFSTSPNIWLVFFPLIITSHQPFSRSCLALAS